MRRRLLIVLLAAGALVAVPACSSDDDTSDTATEADASGGEATEDAADGGEDAMDGADDAADGDDAATDASLCADVLGGLNYLAQQSPDTFDDEAAMIEEGLADAPAEVQDAAGTIIDAEKAVVTEGDTSLRTAPEYSEAMTVVSDYQAEVC